MTGRTASGDSRLVAAVVGANVRDSRSPAIHRAAWRALGLAGTYRAVSVRPAGFRTAVRTLIRDGAVYVNVTIPHKRAAATMADTRSALVRASGAANTLLVQRGRKGSARLRAENTDVAGLLDALGDLDCAPRGRTAVVVGSGGAAAAAMVALRRSGARVVVVARRRGATLHGLRRLPFDAPGLRMALASADLVVSAVPTTAWTQVRLRALKAALAPTTVIMEMAYGRPSPLRGAARRCGARFADGLAMLVHQAAHGVEAATGRRPPLAPLFKAARRSPRR